VTRIERLIVSVDVVLLSVHSGRLCLLMNRRSEEPFRGALALPGVAVRCEEPLAAAARRALVTKAGLGSTFVELVHLEQLATFDGIYRDPRGRTISVAHLGLTARTPEPAREARAAWQPIPALDRARLPFDHDLIVQTALARLRGKLRYTNLAGRLLPEVFRIVELQRIYEAILGRRLNQANFRTKLLRIGLLERVGIQAQAAGPAGGRPPHLYRFRSTDVQPEDRDFL
jgi:8-oxo-dGTP diphosphatase